MFDPHKGQWWNSPPEQRFEAYYMTLRVHYEMPAAEAFATAKKNFNEWGIFFRDPMRSIREAIYAV